MNAMSRRQFCAIVGAGLSGAAVVMAGCSNGDGGSAPTTPGSTAVAGAGSLAGVSFAVRRDPG